MAVVFVSIAIVFVFVFLQEGFAPPLTIQNKFQTGPMPPINGSDFNVDGIIPDEVAWKEFFFSDATF
jgi:hypothetical protein